MPVFILYRVFRYLQYSDVVRLHEFELTRKQMHMNMYLICADVSTTNVSPGLAKEGGQNTDKFLSFFFSSVINGSVTSL